MMPQATPFPKTLGFIDQNPVDLPGPSWSKMPPFQPLRQSGRHKPQVHCHSREMTVRLPPGPIFDLIVQSECLLILICFK